MTIYHKTFDDKFMTFLGLEWWQAIGVTTVCLRIIIFPIMVMAQKSIVQQNKHLVKS